MQLFSQEYFLFNSSLPVEWRGPCASQLSSLLEWRSERLSLSNCYFNVYHRSTVLSSKLSTAKTITSNLPSICMQLKLFSFIDHNNGEQGPTYVLLCCVRGHLQQVLLLLQGGGWAVNCLVLARASLDCHGRSLSSRLHALGCAHSPRHSY